MLLKIPDRDADPDRIAGPGVSAHTHGMVPDLGTRLCAQLRDELWRRKISQRDLARRLTERTGERWSQSRVQKILNGRVKLVVEDVAAIAEMVGLSLVELVREPGREFVADCTPSELRMLMRIRERPDLFEPLTTLLLARETDPERLRRPPHGRVPRKR